MSDKKQGPIDRRTWPNRWATGNHEPVVDCSGDTPLTRQEFKDDADINNLVARMLNGQSVPMSQPQYGDADYTKDLDGAYAAADELVATYNGLPQEVRDTMTKSEFLGRILAGEQLEAFTDLQDQKQPEGTTEETPKTSA